MDKKGVLIGIDYTEEYCRACYFNERRGRVENVVETAGTMGILIPSVLCFSAEKDDWLIGQEARDCSQDTGAFLYTQLLTNTLGKVSYEINGRSTPCSTLFGIFIEKLIDLARLCSGVFPVSFACLAIRRADLEIKRAMEKIFLQVGIEREKLHLISYPESFAYFILEQDEALWRDGALLFDLSTDGFLIDRLTLSEKGSKNMIFINEMNYSLDISVKDIENQVLRPRLDEKLTDIYEEVKGEGEHTGVYFTGAGFDELWFGQTLELISKERRSFRGNNIYARGAALECLLRKEGTKERFSVICRPKTRAQISLEAREKGQAKTIVLSEAAVNWYEASNEMDFILDDLKMLRLSITSLMSGEKTEVVIDLSSFPDRPAGATRIRVNVSYINEFECEICIKDMGLGSFFPSSGKEIRKILDLEGCI